MMTCLPEIATQLVLYDNDAVDVTYNDGSRLQLAPCASSFAYHQAAALDNKHPLQGVTTVKQRTAFVTSTYHQQVTDAVSFRNRFADHPYMCSKLGDLTNTVHIHADVFEVGWPQESSSVIELGDGSLRITSVDEYASVTLAAHKQTFTAEFLCKLSENASKKKFPLPSISRVNSSYYRPSDSTCHEISSISHTPHHGQVQLTDSINEFPLDNKSFNQSNATMQADQSKVSMQSRLSQIRNHSSSSKGIDKSGASISSAILNEASWEYRQVLQNHSVQNYPDNWKHPLELLLNYKRERIYKQYGCVSDSSKSQVTQGINSVDKQSLKNCVFLPLPRSLALNCSNSHLHKWKAADMTGGSDEEELCDSAFVQGRIKVICVNGYIYRFMWCSPRTLEVYPGDGSLLRSSGLAGSFFVHYVRKDTKLEERMYCVDSPPPHVPGMTYSIAKLIHTAARFLSLMQASGNLPSSPCCWTPHAPASPGISVAPSFPLEECTVQGVGRFTANSNGRVRVVFTDRTAVDLVADFSHRLSSCSKHSTDGEEEDTSSPIVLRASDIPQGTCRLMLPNGHYQTVEISQPGTYQRYLQPALDWVAWVNTLPNQRCEFYKDTIHDPQKAHDIKAELNKINCFNYIVEQTVLPKVSPDKVCSLPNDMNNAILEDPCPPHTMLPSSYGTDNSHPGYHGNSRNEGFSMKMVQDILQKTSRTVEDLDKYLAVNGETKPCKI